MNTCEEAADNCGSSPDKCISIFYIWNCLLFIAKGPSIQFSHSVVSDSLWPHGLQHARLPWPSPTPRACSDSCPLSRWCHPTISSSVIPSPPACNLSQHQGLFTMSQFFASGGQSIGVSGFSISPFSEYWGLISFRIDWLDLLVVQGTLKGLLQHHKSNKNLKEKFKEEREREKEKLFKSS